MVNIFSNLLPFVFTSKCLSFELLLCFSVFEIESYSVGQVDLTLTMSFGNLVLSSN